MTVGFIAFHYPAPEQLERFVDRVHRVRDVLCTTAGCVSVDCWVTEDGKAVVSAAHWESEREYAEAFATLPTAEVDIAFDEREIRPREIFTLYSC
ncbi:antibiotic biosynthesis monooxygenase [Nocardia sp. CDC159]|uniref:Antibiotic biosynthesis monooxygenase n=1 Tax=Nocardia pulmonis TaxID=2951408 RepID=A0A9X2E944_9NOCA|nr:MULTISPECIES: antibiotic biosynthesis monooxygenase [Nocardia]MCM6776579.1 antibiotic biosynthesis monooxygenase [Nocardia pulmonis]MCM6789003.1 antibiotic biosynthesis monooxygenase [Nocardia sp. CDC159]